MANDDRAGHDLDARAPPAGVAAVQGIGLTTSDLPTWRKRASGPDAPTRTGCVGRVRFIAAIKGRAVIERILKPLGEDVRGRWFVRARDLRDPWA